MCDRLRKDRATAAVALVQSVESQYSMLHIALPRSLHSSKRRTRRTVIIVLLANSLSSEFVRCKLPSDGLFDTQRASILEVRLVDRNAFHQRYRTISTSKLRDAE